MLSSPQQNAPTFQQNQEYNILVEPSNALEFVCTQFQTAASLRILVTDKGESKFVYRFEIKATNKQDYKVTESSGELQPNVNKVLYFYLKQSAPINKNLKDKFQLVIKRSDVERTQPWQIIFSRKFTIVIESGLKSKAAHSVISPQMNSEMNNVSKFLSSVYSSPNSLEMNRLYQPRSELREAFLPPIPSSNNMTTSNYSNKSYPVSQLTPKLNSLMPEASKEDELQALELEQARLRPSMQITQSKKSDKMKFSHVNINNMATFDPERLEGLLVEEQKLKLELNASIKQIEQMKRKIISIDSENKSNKARARFRIYVNIIIVIVGFLLGIWIKSLNIPSRLQHFVDAAKSKFNFDQTPFVEGSAHQRQSGL